MIHHSISFVFFGTPQLSADVLDHLCSHGLVPSLVVTNPDRPSGRKMALAPSPVKAYAQKHDIPVLQPESPSDPDFHYKLSAINYQLFVVVAYGSILPQALLDIPAHGSLNIHYSLLPKYRGASPIESAILSDDRHTGVSIMLIDKKMDHGPVLVQKAVELHAWPVKSSELRAACNKLGAQLLAETIPLWVEGKVEAREQDHAQATYTKKFTKADGEIDLLGDPYQNFLKIQAFEASIGTYFYSSSKKPARQLASEGALPSSAGELSQPPKAAPSSSFEEEVQSPRGGGVRVIIRSAEFKDGKLHILRVVPEGKKEMSYDEFMRGMR